MLFKTVAKMKLRKLDRRQSIAVFLILLVLSMGTFMYNPQRADAALLSSSSIQLSDSRPSNSPTTYTVTYTFPGTTSIECIDVIFGDTTGHITLTSNPSTTAPTGMTTTSSVKGSVSGGGLTNGNWSLYNSTNGILQYEDSSGQASTATSITITTTTITNPSAATFYAQIATYSTLSTHTCSGLVDNSNVMALVTTSGVSASVSIDPSLTFSVANDGSVVNGATGSNFVGGGSTSTTLPFGTVAAGANADLSQTLTTSTNAAHGYTVYVRYSGQMTDANTDTFRDQSGTPGSPNSFDGSSSQSSFAYTADGPGVTFGSNEWAGLTTTNTSVATRASAQSGDAFHVQYRVEPSNTQAPGTYTTTVIYVATPTF
jgi:hypothetical protein